MFSSQMEHLKCLLHTYLPPTMLQATYLSTHPPTYLNVLPTYLPKCIIYLPTHLFRCTTYLFTYPSIHLPIDHMPTYLPITYPPPTHYLFTYYLPTYPPNYHFLQHTYLID